MNPIFLKTNKMPGHVYLIGSRKFHWFKIGKSSNATIRVNQLGILLPFRIEVLAIWKTRAPTVLERQLHEKHAANRINGEWFNFTTEELKGIIFDMLWASTEGGIDFENLPEDYAPDGKTAVFKFKKKKCAPKARGTARKERSPEENEFREWKDAVWREFSELRTPEERKKRRREIEIEMRRRRKLLPKVLDTKTNSA